MISYSLKGLPKVDDALLFAITTVCKEKFCNLKRLLRNGNRGLTNLMLSMCEIL
jgi:hypothetical protein